MTDAEEAIPAGIAALEDQIRAATTQGDWAMSIRLLRLLIALTADHREHRVLPHPLRSRHREPGSRPARRYPYAGLPTK
jgi:hypothetical protein